MGSDLYMLHQQISINSHGELVAMLRKLRDLLDDFPVPDELETVSGRDALVAEIDRILNNASIR